MPDDIGDYQARKLVEQVYGLNKPKSIPVRFSFPILIVWIGLMCIADRMGFSLIEEWEWVPAGNQRGVGAWAEMVVYDGALLFFWLLVWVVAQGLCYAEHAKIKAIEEQEFIREQREFEERRERAKPW